MKTIYDKIYNKLSIENKDIIKSYMNDCKNLLEKDIFYEKTETNKLKKKYPYIMKASLDKSIVIEFTFNPSINFIITHKDFDNISYELCVSYDIERKSYMLHHCIILKENDDSDFDNYISYCSFDYDTQRIEFESNITPFKNKDNEFTRTTLLPLYNTSFFNLICEHYDNLSHFKEMCLITNDLNIEENIIADHIIFNLQKLDNFIKT